MDDVEDGLKYVIEQGWVDSKTSLLDKSRKFQSKEEKSDLNINDPRDIDHLSFGNKVQILDRKMYGKRFDGGKTEIKPEQQEQNLRVEDTTISKSSQLPHRLFMYSTFQKLIESSVTDNSVENPFQEQLRDLYQDTIDSALVSILAEMEKDECFTVAEA